MRRTPVLEDSVSSPSTMLHTIEDPGPDDWRPLTVTEAAAEMQCACVPWWIAGGWAIDCFIGRKTRTHADLDLAILRRDQSNARRHLQGWTLYKTGQVTPSGLAVWEPGVELDSGINSVWAAAGSSWRFQILLMESDGDHWVFRRNPQLRAPVERLGWIMPTGIPVLRPEVQLLYKATCSGRRPKDDADFVAVLPYLSSEAKAWLASALRMCQEGEHPWAPALE